MSYPIRVTLWGSAQIVAMLTSCVGLSASALLRPFSKTISYNLASNVANALWSYMQWMFENPHNGKVTISGDEIPSDESALVISNHLSYCDFYLIHALAKRRNMLGRCRYFAKDSLKYIPVLGWSLLLINMIMVTRNWMRDQSELYRVFSPIRHLKLPIWLITYVEGTRFTPQKQLASREFCESRGKAPLQQVLYPRHKGFFTTVSQFRDSHIKYVYDFTLVYKDKKNRLQRAPTPIEVHGYGDISKHYTFHIHVRRFAIADIPEDEEGATKWLEERWYEKDEILIAMNAKWTDAGILGHVEQM